jgi:WD40 repeat protein
MCTEFCPSNPKLIAGGAFNGQIFIWDTNSTDEPLLVASGLTSESHFESITKISWLTASSETNLKIASMSTDGKIIQWNLFKNAEGWKLEPLKRSVPQLKFQLTPPQLLPCRTC